MSAVGIRELKEHTSRIVRRVREEEEAIEVTRRREVNASVWVSRVISPCLSGPFGLTSIRGRGWRLH